MNINLEIHLKIGDSRWMQRGSFNVRYKEDIAQLAYDWIQRIRFETGHRHTVIEKVIWNNEHDITEEVIALARAPIPQDDLPF